MTDELEPLSDLARRALDAESHRNEGSDMRDRLFSRILTSVAIPVGAPPPNEPPAATAAQAGFLVQAAPFIAGAFVLGGLAGAGVHAWATRVPAIPAPSAHVPVAPVESTPILPPSTDTPTLSVSSLAIASATARPPAPVPSSAHSSVESNDTDLAAERTLIDRARMALSRSDTGAALDALGTHASQFPKGRLREEREMLAIQALAQSGRTDEARARAARFRTSYPDSLFLRAVDRLAAP